MSFRDEYVVGWDMAAEHGKRVSERLQEMWGAQSIRGTQQKANVLEDTMTWDTGSGLQRSMVFMLADGTRLEIKMEKGQATVTTQMGKGDPYTPLSFDGMERHHRYIGGEEIAMRKIFPDPGYADRLRALFKSGPASITITPGKMADDLAGQIDALQKGVARSVAELSEGMENRLPSLESRKEQNQDYQQAVANYLGATVGQVCGEEVTETSCDYCNGSREGSRWNDETRMMEVVKDGCKYCAV